MINPSFAEERSGRSVLRGGVAVTGEWLLDSGQWSVVRGPSSVCDGASGSEVNGPHSKFLRANWSAWRNLPARLRLMRMDASACTTSLKAALFFATETTCIKIYLKI